MGIKKAPDSNQQSQEAESRLRPTGPSRYLLEPIKPGDFDYILPEFGRCQDLQRIFGLKRGSAYNLLSAGKIKGCVIRIKGKKSGLRLFDIESVRTFIRSQMSDAQAGDCSGEKSLNDHELQVAGESNSTKEVSA